MRWWLVQLRVDPQARPLLRDRWHSDQRLAQRLSECAGLVPVGVSVHGWTLPSLSWMTLFGDPPGPARCAHSVANVEAFSR